MALLAALAPLARAILPSLLGGAAQRAGTALATRPMTRGLGFPGSQGIRQLIRAQGPSAVRAVLQRGRQLGPAVRGLLGAGGAVDGVAPRGFHISRRTGNLVRNRRMRPTNVRALRRAIRRVRGFQRVTRKVNRLFPRRGRVVFAHRGRRRRRTMGDIGDLGDVRGDELFMAEDLADLVDEAEDFGVEPFREEDDVE